MTKAELKSLMEYLQAIDNRQVNSEKLQAWYDLIGYMDYTLAKNSVIMASRDPSISYVEAKHVIAMSQRIKEQQKTEESRKRALEPEKPVKQGNPMPKCQHGIGLLLCDPCCRLAAQQAGLIK